LQKRKEKVAELIEIKKRIVETENPIREKLYRYNELWKEYQMFEDMEIKEVF